MRSLLSGAKCCVLFSGIPLLLVLARVARRGWIRDKVPERVRRVIAWLLEEPTSGVLSRWSDAL